MCKFLCFSFAESAFITINEANFFQEVVCWYSSMKKFKIESYKFCALCTLKSDLINLFPVNFVFCCESGVFLPLLLTLVGCVVHFFLIQVFLYTRLLGFCFLKILTRIFHVYSRLVYFGVYIFSARLYIFWKVVTERNFLLASKVAHIQIHVHHWFKIKFIKRRLRETIKTTTKRNRKHIKRMLSNKSSGLWK